MGEAALVSLIALLACLVLVWRSGTLRNIGRRRKMGFAAIWIAVFAVLALIFRSAA